MCSIFKRNLTYKQIKERNKRDAKKLWPYLSEPHPLAKKLLSQKIRRYNRRAEQWGYNTRVEYNIKTFIAIPSPLTTYKFPEGGFWKGFGARLKAGYRNKYLDDLGGQIIDESCNMRQKMPTWKRYWKFVYFWINYF
jgi:hypothetical protein